MPADCKAGVRERERGAVLSRSGTQKGQGVVSIHLFIYIYLLADLYPAYLIRVLGGLHKIR